MKYLSLMSALFLFSCGSRVTNIPFVVKNGCGKYAIISKIYQMSGGALDTLFFGLRNHCKEEDAPKEEGGYFIMYTTCTLDTLKNGLIRKDTSWGKHKPGETMFDTQKEAQALVDKYTVYINSQQRISDSIKNCHTYSLP